MLHSVRRLRDFTLRATDGEIGAVRDFYFDDARWVVRYLVADTGGWLTGRDVLISPRALGEPDETNGVLPVALMKEQIEQSPDIATDKPIDRQKEGEYYRYYGWAPYWGGPALWGMDALPMAVLAPSAATAIEEAIEEERAHSDPHLRSAEDVTGYRIKVTDGEIGHVDDFIVDAESWAIRYFVVDTGKWLLAGRKVLLTPDWITEVDWADHSVALDLTKGAIERSPEFDLAALNREDEARLHAHYGRRGYWE